ncbi:MAG TPA: 6-carboxytetrahydropterin synthase [Planctomycetota bacterium]|nr:6-carboxytetrahydropterin synthase [Planctomycetota bacterium]
MSRRVDLTRIYHFNAAHRLYHPRRDDRWNHRIFGKCSNPDGHGHNYLLEVTVRGVPDPDTGWVYPLELLDRQVHELVIEPFDHHNLNVVLEREGDIPPTSEVFVVAIWRQLEQAIASPTRLHRLKLWETERNTFEYWGPERSRAG